MSPAMRATVRTIRLAESHGFKLGFLDAGFVRSAESQGSWLPAGETAIVLEIAEEATEFLASVGVTA